MKIDIEAADNGKTISWFTDAGVCVATASHTRVEVAEYAPASIHDAANGAYHELSGNPRADLRHYLGMTLPADDELDVP